MANARLPLRPFQAEAINALNRDFADGYRSLVLQMPTGAGKTVTAAAIASESAKPIVFLCHRDELVRQTIEKFGLYDDSMTMAVCKAEQGRNVEDLIGRDIIVASAQTLARENRLDVLRRAVPNLPMMIVDECHHSSAATWARAVTTLDADRVVGLTATPKRGDGKALDTVFEKVSYSIPMSVLVDAELLARPVGIRIGTDIDLTKVATRQGDFAEGQLSEVVNTPERNARVVAAYLKHAAPKRQHAIAFCVDIQHVIDLTATFVDAGVSAEMIIGATPAAERQAIYARHAAGETNVLVSCMVLTEGFDQPEADCALMCRPTQSQSLYIQMAGRVLRHLPTKRDALIIDFVDLTARHTLQTIVTLKGDDDPDVLLPDDEDEEFDLFGEVKSESERQARIKAASEYLGNLLDDAKHAWQTLDDGTAFATTGQGSYLAIVRHGEGFLPVSLEPGRGYRQPAIMRTLFERPSDPATAMEIAAAIIPANSLTDPDAKWRDGLASAKQIEFGKKLRLRFDEATITKGELSKLIDRTLFERALSNHVEA